MWSGVTRTEDADEYAAYMKDTGVREYSGTPGNRGVYMLRRVRGDLTDFAMVTIWDSLDAVKRFAGDAHETAVFYPRDDELLVKRDLTASHWEVVELNDGDEGG
jgi:heme-degrading monooxygenase HmoA